MFKRKTADDMPDVPDAVRQQVGKRLTLNLLIQGASSHAFLTAHHVVADELEQLRPGLTRRYDQFATHLMLGYFVSELVVLHGLPARFWRRAQEPSHPFYDCPLLARHGAELARETKRHLLARARAKGVLSVPVLQSYQALWLLGRIYWAERHLRPVLCELAVRAAAGVWGIGEDRLEAQITTNIAFGHLRQPRTWAGKVARHAACCSYGGVERRNGRFQVVARGWNFSLVLGELIKGTAELICLHGLGTLDDATYEAVIAEADQLEYEFWLVQAGAEAWRRLLAVLPEGRGTAEVLMHLARLDPEPLNELMLAVMEDPDRARLCLRSLGRGSSSDASS